MFQLERVRKKTVGKKKNQNIILINDTNTGYEQMLKDSPRNWLIILHLIPTNFLTINF